MAKVLNQLELARQSSACVFFEGETGSGKEHLARVIHYGGPQRANWFIPLDCRRLAADELARILERLLDLHLTGSRSGARPQPGTLYLADVEYLPRDLQERLAQAFGSRDEKSPPSLRLMSSGARSLKEAMAADAVRPDLFALLTPLSIEIPPLRSRPEDLPLLAQHFLEELNRQGDKQAGGFAEEVWHLFKRYAWPGNLDELNLVIREAFARSSDGLIKPPDLPFRFRTALDAHELPPPPAPPPLLLDEALTKVETNLIQIALERSKYNKSKAADLLGINRARLYRRMEQLGIEDREGPAPEA
jgi:DNA-binding NtrC family response regulator